MGSGRDRYGEKLTFLFFYPCHTTDIQVFWNLRLFKNIAQRRWKKFRLFVLFQRLIDDPVNYFILRAPNKRVKLSHIRKKPEPWGLGLRIRRSRRRILIGIEVHYSPMDRNVNPRKRRLHRFKHHHEVTYGSNSRSYCAFNSVKYPALLNLRHSQQVAVNINRSAWDLNKMGGFQAAHFAPAYEWQSTPCSTRHDLRCLRQKMCLILRMNRAVTDTLPH